MVPGLGAVTFVVLVLLPLPLGVAKEGMVLALLTPVGFEDIPGIVVGVESAGCVCVCV